MPSRPRLALALLTLVYVSNFIDRQLVGILAQPMKADLGLSDRQLGMLGGLAFALFYTLLAIPIARLAERRGRVSVIAGSLGLWSAMTAACGLAGGFGQIFLARIGVGIGEAGCSPAAQSLIADMHAPERRATALGIYALGIPIGQLLGAAGGGWLATTLGWRTAFLALGLAGLPLALIVRLALTEAPRAAMAPIVTRTLLADLLRRPAFLHMMAGGALASFAGYALSTFAVSLLVRSTGLPLAQAATWFGLAAGALGAIGTFGGGWLADRLGARGLVAGGGLILAGLLFPIIVLQTDPVTIGLLALVPMATCYFYFGPLFATTADSAAPGGRAGAVAVLLFVMNAIGLGLGPITAGALSDHFAAGAAASLCLSGDICAAASAIGLRHALALTSLVYLWAGLHFLLGGRALRRA